MAKLTKATDLPFSGYTDVPQVFGSSQYTANKNLTLSLTSSLRGQLVKCFMIL